MSEEFKELEVLDLKPVELQGNGLCGNGINCSIETTNFDLYLEELSA